MRAPCSTAERQGSRVGEPPLSPGACRVEDHRSAAVDMAGPAGGTVGHAHAAFSFYHAFDCHDFRGADDVCSPAWVTVELRCHADFKYASAADVASPPSDHLTLGIDVEVRDEQRLLMSSLCKLSSRGTTVDMSAGQHFAASPMGFCQYVASWL